MLVPLELAFAVIYELCIFTLESCALHLPPLAQTGFFRSSLSSKMTLRAVRITRIKIRVYAKLSGSVNSSAKFPKNGRSQRQYQSTVVVEGYRVGGF